MAPLTPGSGTIVLFSSLIVLAVALIDLSIWGRGVHAPPDLGRSENGGNPKFRGELKPLTYFPLTTNIYENSSTEN